MLLKSELRKQQYNVTFFDCSHLAYVIVLWQMQQFMCYYTLCFSFVLFWIQGQFPSTSPRGLSLRGLCKKRVIFWILRYLVFKILSHFKICNGESWNFLECQILKFQYSARKISKSQNSECQILKCHDLVANQWLIITRRNDFNIILLITHYHLLPLKPQLTLSCFSAYSTAGLIVLTIKVNCTSSVTKDYRKKIK